MPDTIQAQIDAFLACVYARTKAAGYVAQVPVPDVAGETGMPTALVHKIAVFLERQGLLEHADQAIELTIDGLLKLEGAQAKPVGAGPPG